MPGLVERVRQRIATAVSNDLPGAQWESSCLTATKRTPFACPAGRSGVYRILPITKNEAGLATVMDMRSPTPPPRHGGSVMSEAMGMQVSESCSWRPLQLQPQGPGRRQAGLRTRVTTRTHPAPQPAPGIRGRRDGSVLHGSRRL